MYRHACSRGVALSQFGNWGGDPSHAANLRYRPSYFLDFQVGLGDQPYAKGAAQRAAVALNAGRAAGLPVVFSKVKFRAGYRDVADSNKAFALIKTKNLFPPDESKLISILQPAHDEIIVDKDRFCAFSGNDLKEILRSRGVKHLVMTGVQPAASFCPHLRRRRMKTTA